MYQQRYALAKFGMESKDTKTSTGKGCEYYIKYFFMYASLIQLLIIVALVLFMVYDNAPKLAKERQERLEQDKTGLILQLKNVSTQNLFLKQLLNKTQMAHNKQNIKLNESKIILDQTNKSLNACRVENADNKKKLITLATAFDRTKDCIMTIKQKDQTCEGQKIGLIAEREKLRQEMNALRENKNTSDIILNKKVQSAESAREKCLERLINLRQEKDAVVRENSQCESKCSSMLDKFEQQIRTMANNFDAAIKGALSDNVLVGTNEELKIKMEKIKANCTPVSNELHQQVNSVLVKMKDTIKNSVADNAKLSTENINLQEKIKQCEKNRTATVEEMKRKMTDFELSKDKEVQNVLQEKMQLRKEKDELGKKVEEKQKQIFILNNAFEALNTSFIKCTKTMPAYPSSNNPAGTDWMANVLQIAQQMQEGQKGPGRF
ncbi:plasmalemma vesicle-associated protein [Protopterus annectens]|uniref:plasmalemma vesicle-associated protein n=1 Tax=Protopterus annectens TaxID=7888 RepID=UPI001CFB7AAB|nr:plasmalemma vesicle-associated protein [Protopterus annectens]